MLRDTQVKTFIIPQVGVDIWFGSR